MKGRACVLVMGLGLLVASEAGAEDLRRGPDTTYGRLDGDMSAEAAVGTSLGGRMPRLSVDLRLRYLSSVGLFAGYEEGRALSDKASPSRLVAFGAEVRPLFLARWLTGRHFGWPRLDLAIDSVGLELGAAFAAPRVGPFEDSPFLHVGVVRAFPLGQRADGPWLRLRSGYRASSRNLSGAPDPSDAPSYFFVAFEFGLQRVFSSGLVGIGDRP